MRFDMYKYKSGKANIAIAKLTWNPNESDALGRELVSAKRTRTKELDAAFGQGTVKVAILVLEEKNVTNPDPNFGGVFGRRDETKKKGSFFWLCWLGFWSNEERNREFWRWERKFGRWDRRTKTRALLLLECVYSICVVLFWLFIFYFFIFSSLGSDTYNATINISLLTNRNKQLLHLKLNAHKHTHTHSKHSFLLSVSDSERKWIIILYFWPVFSLFSLYLGERVKWAHLFFFFFPTTVDLIAPKEKFAFLWKRLVLWNSYYRRWQVWLVPTFALKSLCKFACVQVLVQYIDNLTYVYLCVFSDWMPTLFCREL